MLLVDEWMVITSPNVDNDDWTVVENEEFVLKPFLVKVASKECCCPAKKMQSKLKKPVDIIHFWAVVIGEAIAFELRVVNKALKTAKSMFSFY